MKFIDEFKGEYSFLSNFYDQPIYFRRELYPTSEHAYQACKTSDPLEKEAIRKAATPAIAKKIGRNVTLINQWDQIKVSDMYWILKTKFAHKELKQMLLNTNEDILIEGNWWGDKIWGVCRGEGENLLGQLLMLIRSEIRATGG